MSKYICLALLDDEDLTGLSAAAAIADQKEWLFRINFDNGEHVYVDVA
jgi:hypothetical protein